MTDVFTVRSGSLPAGARVVGFRGSEGISRPYVFEIYLSLPSEESHAFDLADAVNAKATLTLDRQDGRPPFAFHGLFSELSLLHEMGGRALVRASLVPQLWRLSQTYHSRIFTDQSLPDILKETLEDGGLGSGDYVFKLAGQYKPEEHVCQYQESHLDFISRWMEREGLYYYFEQGDDHEKLVITDNRSFQDELLPDPVRFYALAGGDVTARECLETFVCRHRSLPGSVRYQDYDYTKPTLKVAGSATVSKTGLGELHVHGARFFTPDAGKRLATLRAEELRAREVVFTGSGTAFYLRAGYTFALEDHPRPSFDAKYLVTEVEHHGNQAASTPELRRMTGLDGDEVYRVEMTAIAKDVQFRAERRTPWPRVYGTEHGVIDGEAESEYAQIDDHGRYAVRFSFDESDLKAGKASTWVRMVQPHGGGIEGWHFPLRKGTEVLFTFLGGDPDRPVIAGVVPNTLTPSPVTRGNHTKNVIQTGGRNRMELDDKAGAQRITLSTPYANTMIRMGSPNADHELIVRTDESTLLDAGKNWDVTVGADLTEEVQGTTDETYRGLHTTQSWSARIAEIGGTYSQTCHNEVIREVHGNEKDTIHGTWTQNIDGALLQTISGPVTHIKKDSHVLLVHGTTSDTFIGLANKNFIGGQLTMSAGDFVTVKLAAEVSVTVGASVSLTDGLRLGITGGVAVNLNAALVLNLMPSEIFETNNAIKTVAGAMLENSPVHVLNLGSLIVT